MTTLEQLRPNAAVRGIHPAFCQSLKANKGNADAMVAASLYHRALGYSHPAVKILSAAGQVTKVPYIEHYPPDTTACIFWLKNRQSGAWRDRVEQAVSLPAIDTEGPVPGLDALLEKMAGLIHVEKPTTRTEAT